MSRRPCNFFHTPAGCKRGDSCSFAHQQRPSQARASNSQSPSHSSTRGQSNVDRRDQAVPPGVCNFYWKEGDCTRGFQCKYRHQQNPAANHGGAASVTRSATVHNSIAPFLTAEGMAKLFQTGTDGHFPSSSAKPRSPSEVHNLLKRFLDENYRFRTSADVYAFLLLISEASSNNSSWSPEDGQLFLNAIGTGNGILRLDDIVSWTQVSMRAGRQPTALSFQRGYLPLLRYLSSDFVIKSITSHIVNALYTIVMQHFDHFAEVVEACMNDAINNLKSFKDPTFPESMQKELLGSQIIASLARVLFECLTRFKNAVGTYPALRPLVHNLDTWTNIWISDITSKPPAFDDWFAAETTTNSARDHIVNYLRGQVQQVVNIVDRDHKKNEQAQRRSLASTPLTSGASSEGIIAALETTYQGPGVSRDEGPRHDNDHIDIADIRIAPTHLELVSTIPPFLPANMFGAPHPLAAESMERLLDIQFRLLREELTGPMRTSVQLILEDLQNQKDKKTQLNQVLSKRGGKYRGHVAGQQDTIMFNVYTNVDFFGISTDNRGISVGLNVDTPPGQARSPQSKARATFWEKNSSKRLMQGGLVALVWNRGRDTNVYLGTIASSVKDHTQAAERQADRIAIRVSFFDPEVELRVLQEAKQHKSDRMGTKILVEATIMYESVRPFLEALRAEPQSVPFSKYLVHRPSTFFNNLSVDPPAYARVPGFAFQLSSLFPPEAGVANLRLNVSDPGSVAIAREELRTKSRLDPSQADAVVAALTREVVLIQGPPGTGKSYTGVELIRVLIANKAAPILMIAFTNHALDHMLVSVLDASITKKIVRLGSRSADERISEFSIENLEKIGGRSRLDRAFASNYRALKAVEEEIKKLMKDFAKEFVESQEIINYLEIRYPNLHQSLLDVPPWISTIRSATRSSGEAWTTVGKGGHDTEADDSVYHYWRIGEDLDFLMTAANPVRSHAETGSAAHEEVTNAFSMLNIEEDNSSASSNHETDIELEESDADTDTDGIPVEEAWLVVPPTTIPSNSQPWVPPSPPPPHQPEPVAIASPELTLQPSDFNLDLFFGSFGYTAIPIVPSTHRPIEELLDDDNVWLMSRTERERLHVFLSNEVRLALQDNRVDEFRRLRDRHAEAHRIYQEGKEEARRQLLKNVDIIGCTTTGAAKLGSLLKSIGPRIMLVEEAGQVLEAHVLANLVPSVQQLILIGDPLQLRPTINTYALSMDHRQGKQLYKFDMSLLERLSTSGMAMSQIVVQRRMRPSISDLIRKTLYPNLEDHEIVHSRPRVRGMPKDVFFFDHSHKENGGEDDSVSKYNQFEVDMIKDLVMYFLRQGSYSLEGDIVVLCAYLGQLSRVRDALSNEVAVIIDDRDQRELNDREADQETEVLMPASTVEHVKVSRRVLLRTVDNFQGEEAKIVILSLVRNSGSSDEDKVFAGHASAQKANIGFLRSPNRANVALSRAREGMYIFGNRTDLASRSPMWDKVLSELDKVGAVGTSLPIACHQHPDAVQHVSKPGQLPRIAPDGGCLRQCDTRLRCGHTCPYKCHPDDPNHVTVQCAQRCTRLCVRGHPCVKECAQDCGLCHTKVKDVELPCGHVAPFVHCYQLDELSNVRCQVKVTKQLPHCEHEEVMKCSDDPANFPCTKPCKGIMSCCGRTCKASCHQCLKLNYPADAEDVGVVHRQRHGVHYCEKPLFCGHLCGKACSEDHECKTSCKEACMQKCIHAACKNYCSSPCSPCQEACAWRCAHHSCPVPCGSVCARLPCDKRCQSMLVCGHRCPSVCGEDCSIQICPQCAPPALKDNIVDVIMQRTLGDIEPDGESLDELIITLPACRHVYSVETLDGHCELSDYYDREGIDGRWLGLKAPPVEFKMPPTCPTCRTAITSPRYGRVFKRAGLDILENNVASNMSRMLGEVHGRMLSAPKAELEAQLRAEASKASRTTVTVSVKEAKQKQKKQASLLKQIRKIPVSFDAVNPAHSELFGIHTTEATVWKKVVQKLLAAYNDAFKIAALRSAHMHGWEASFGYLYKQEMDLAAERPLQAPRDPHEHAMRMARLRVGQPPPRADQRFVIEAFCTTISIRLTLSYLARAWLESLQTDASYPTENRRMWGSYIAFIFRTCHADAGIALSIAEASESHRLKPKVVLLQMRIDLEQFQFNMQMMQQGGHFDAENRSKLADNAEKKANDAAQLVAGVKNAQRRANVAQDGEEFYAAANVILDDWNDLQRSIRQETWYQPVSREEMYEVVKALNFSHTGHWYRCPNGHAYAIGECGGAMQRSRCPECGVEIGGSDHNLVSTNSRDTQLEELSRQQGAAQSPWDWAR